MEIQIGYYPQLFLLVLTRVGSIVGGVTILGKGRVPPPVRLAVALALTILFTPLLAAKGALIQLHLNNTIEIVEAMLNEMLLGFVLALACDIVFTVCNLAGFIIGFGSSLTMAQVIDPTSGVSGEIIGAILQLVCMMIFILSDAHLVLIRLIFQSFSIIPPNPGAWLTQDLMSDIVMLLKRIYICGVRLAAPAIAVAFILDLSFGLISRMAPDFDILFMSMPVRLFAGLATFGFILRYGASFFDSLCQLMERSFARILIG
jgi:flagellar biosynthetic protein FliR